jgi:spore coat protein U-like protein
MVLCAFCAAPALASGCTLAGGAPTLTATDIHFAAYSASDSLPDEANGNLKIQCPLGIGLLPSFEIALSAGVGGIFSPRQMAMGASSLSYNIYTTSGYSAVWGDGTGGTVTQSFSALLSLGTVTYATYGRIPAGQYIAAGTYDDSITVTLTY